MDCDTKIDLEKQIIKQILDLINSSIVDIESKVYEMIIALISTHTDYNIDAKITLENIISNYGTKLLGPASTKWHESFDYGLIMHSALVYLAVLNTMDQYRKEDGSKFTVEDIDIFAVFFHDLCKAGMYKFYKDQKTGEYKWMYNPDYSGVEHGCESLVRLLKCGWTPKTKGWELAVAYHMGAFGVSPTEQQNFSKYSYEYNEVLMLHTADMISTKVYSKFECDNSNKLFN